MEERVLKRFQTEWPKDFPQHHQIVQFLVDTYRRFCDEGLADREFSTQLATGSPAVYEQRKAELLLADFLWKDGFTLSSADHGPDFRAEKNGEVLWIELITPEPKGIPPDTLVFPREGVWTFPAQEILLRWTSAIDEKASKLLGTRDGKKKGYLADGVVQPHERYIIAVNDGMLVPWPDQITGISQFPFPVEALMAVGPYQVNFDPVSLKMVSGNHQQRISIPKPKGQAVPATTFFNAKYEPISAVLGITLRDDVAIGRPHRNVLVYNPLAKNPLPPKLLTSQEDWVCDVLPTEYTIHRLDDEPFRGDFLDKG